MKPIRGQLFKGYGFTFEVTDVLETVRVRVTAPSGTKSRLCVPLVAFEKWTVGLMIVRPKKVLTSEVVVG